MYDRSPNGRIVSSRVSPDKRNSVRVTGRRGTVVSPTRGQDQGNTAHSGVWAEQGAAGHSSASVDGSTGVDMRKVRV